MRFPVASPKTGSVHDEGRDYRGRDAIRQWKQAAEREIPIRSADGQRANAWKRR